MNIKRTLAISIAALILTVSACYAQKASAPKSVALTVYNAGFALVKDTRNITLIKGVNSLEIVDVAAKIDPTSILFKSLTAPNSVSLLEQNYQYDLISPNSILDKSIGQFVTFTGFDSNGKPFTQSGVLLSSYKNGGIVIKTYNGSLVMNPQGQVSTEKMPEGLRSTPTLNWLLQSDTAGDQQAEISYMTNGIGWKADYVALVNKDDTKLDLAGWVSLNNQSGTTYHDAKLTLMAGDVRRTQSYDTDNFDMKGNMEMRAAAAPAFQEKSFFEYHMYTMQRPTTIRDNETKQLSLLNASNAGVTKELIYDARGDWWRSWWYPGRTELDPGGGYDTSNYHKVNVVLELKNSKENGMGMPLPKGKISVYKLDDDGSQQFIGDDQIDHTPKDEKVRLYIGDSFDVVGDYKRVDYKKISNNTIEESFQVNIRNHKESAVDVKVVDHVWSDWKVTSTSHKFEKKDAHTIEFPVKVPANGEVEVTYTIRTKW